MMESYTVDAPQELRRTKGYAIFDGKHCISYSEDGTVDGFIGVSGNVEVQ